MTERAHEPGATLDLIGGYGALAGLVPPGRSGVDELLAERRRRAPREATS